MPLNAEQRQVINQHIEHFFYELKTDSAALKNLRAALEKPFAATPAEAKEVEEKSAATDTSFNELSTLLSTAQKTFKTNKKRRITYKKKGEDGSDIEWMDDIPITFEELNPDPTTVQDATEYIIFYSLCCLQFHLEQPNNDDFDLEAWLKTPGRGITPEELSAPWQSRKWLERICTDKAFERNQWDIKSTLTLLDQHKNTDLFKTPPAANEDFGEFDWNLPELNKRTYHAEIRYNEHNIRDAAGKITKIIPSLDLVVQAIVSPDLTLTHVLPSFKPFPNAFAVPNETPEQRRIRDRRNHRTQEKIKAEAAVIAEREAIKLILSHLKPIKEPDPLPIPSSNASVSAPSLQQLAESSLALSDDDANELDGAFVAEYAALHSDADENVDFMARDAGHTPPAPDVSHVAADYADSASANIPVAAQSVASSPAASVANNPPASDASSIASILASLRLADVNAANNVVAQDLRHALLASIQDEPDNDLPGMKLLTYQFYYDEVQANRLSLIGLETFSPEETDNLVDDTVRSLIAEGHLTIDQGMGIKPHVNELLQNTYYRLEFIAKRLTLARLDAFSPEDADNLVEDSICSLVANGHLTIDQGAKVKPHIKKLLATTPYYIQHIHKHPEELHLLLNATPEQASFLSLPSVTNLQTHNKMLLQTAFMIQPLAHPIFKEWTYARYLLEHPEAIPLLFNITLAQQENLLNETIKEMIARALMPFTFALMLTAKQREFIAHKNFQRLFLVGEESYLLLTKITDETIDKLLQPKINTLIESKMLSAQQAIRFITALTPLRIQVFETEPYTSLLKEHKDSEPHLLMLLPEDDLPRLLRPPIYELIKSNIMSLPEIIDASDKLLEFICGDRTNLLLHSKKITSKQVASWEKITWLQIESNANAYLSLFHNTDNNQQPDYIPLKIWSEYLHRRILKTYQTHLKSNSVSPDVAIRIKAHIIATSEKISEEALCNQTIALFLQSLLQETPFNLQHLPSTRRPFIYNNIITTIENAMKNPAPDWRSTLDKVVQYAQQGVDAIKTKVTFDPPQQTRFNPQKLFSRTPEDIAHYCKQLVHAGGFLQSRNRILAPTFDVDIKPDSPPSLRRSVSR